MKLGRKINYALWGFAFGTAGLYVMAILSLAIPLFETILSFFMIPGRVAAAVFAGEEASFLESMLLWLFSGLFYAAIFYMVISLVPKEITRLLKKVPR